MSLAKNQDCNPWQSPSAPDVYEIKQSVVCKFLVNNKKPEGDLFDELAGLYRTKDGFVRIHTNFPQ